MAFHRGALAAHARWMIGSVPLGLEDGDEDMKFPMKVPTTPACDCEDKTPHSAHRYSELCNCETDQCESKFIYPTVITSTHIKVTRLRICASGNLVSQIIACGLFPCSAIAPRTAFSLEFLELCDTFQLNGVMTSIALCLHMRTFSDILNTYPKSQ
jgi:hypothetical protein